MEEIVVKSDATELKVRVVPAGQLIGLQMEVHPVYEDGGKRYTVQLTPENARAVANLLVFAVEHPEEFRLQAE